MFPRTSLKNITKVNGEKNIIALRKLRLKGLVYYEVKSLLALNVESSTYYIYFRRKLFQNSVNKDVSIKDYYLQRI